VLEALVVLLVVIQYSIQLPVLAEEVAEPELESQEV
jgi:hypothetical protein